MASEPPLQDGERHRRLHGRVFKVTVCDADPEIAAKIARMQTGNSLKNETEGVEETSFEVAENEISAEDLEHEVLVPPQPAPESPRDGVIESDGPCLSRPKKGKIEDSGGAYEKVSADAGPHPVVTEPSSPKLLASPASAPVDPNQNDLHSAEDVSISDQDESGTLPCEDVPDSGINTAFSSQESFPQDSKEEPYVNMDIDDDDDLASPNDDPQLDENASSRPLYSVSNRIDLEEYSQAEWKGTTHTAEHMRLGYSKIMDLTSCSAMRRIRGDNYCGLRATCFQILSQNLDVLRSWEGNTEKILDIPQKLAQFYRCTWLKQWSFAGRLRVSQKKSLETLKQCLQAFCDQLKAARSIEHDDDRVRHFMQYFNSGQQEEVLLFEAMKLLMLHFAVMLHDDRAKEKVVPDFAWLLFARDTSENPEQLMKNHLNTVGDSGGLEQVEMILLGHALNITIRVTRPSKVDQEDFVTFFPDDHKDDWDTCNLIAEDDRHYNIIIP